MLKAKVQYGFTHGISETAVNVIPPIVFVTPMCINDDMTVKEFHSMLCYIL